jgi:hypothetical protein
MPTIETTDDLTRELAAVEKVFADVDRRAQAAAEAIRKHDLTKRVEVLETKLCFLDPQPEAKPDLAPPKHWSFKALRKDVDLWRILREAEQEGARGVVIDLPGCVLMGLRIDKFELEWQATLEQNPVRFRAWGQDEWLLVVGPLGCPNDAADRLRDFLAEYDEQMAKRYRVTVQVF